MVTVIQRAQIKIAKQEIRALPVKDRVESSGNFVRNDAGGNGGNVRQRLSVNVRQPRQHVERFIRIEIERLMFDAEMVRYRSGIRRFVMIPAIETERVTDNPLSPTLSQ